MTLEKFEKKKKQAFTGENGWRTVSNSPEKSMEKI
jgi:hypothetical protein